MNIFDMNFFVIGAQKCATSWMYYCLNEHPEICVPKKKQEIGYIGGEMFQRKGETWFMNRFSPTAATRTTGDVSVDYLYDPDAPGNIGRYVRKPLLIVSLRHPVDRLISAYYWFVRRSKLPNLPLEQGLAPILRQSTGFPDKLDGPAEEIVRRGCYGEQLENFLKYFPPENLYIILFERISREPRESIQSIYRFLSVDPSFVPQSLEAKPKKNTYNPMLLALERTANVKMLAKIVNFANQAIAKKWPTKPALSNEAREKLQELYEPHIKKTREVLFRLPQTQRPANDVLKNLWGKENLLKNHTK